MPKQIRAIDDITLEGAGVYDLDPATPLLACQAGKLLGRSKTRLDGDRRDSNPPPSYSDGRKVWYRLDAVLAERARIQGATLEEVRTAARARRASAMAAVGAHHASHTFAGFLASGGAQDTWPIATVSGCPVDFFATLGSDIDEDDVSDIEDMTLEDFLEERLRFARLQERQRDATEIGSPTQHLDLPRRERGGI